MRVNHLTKACRKTAFDSHLHRSSFIDTNPASLKRMDSNEADAASSLCNRCRTIDFSTSILFHRPADAPDRWDGLPYQPSELSGKYLVHPHHASIRHLVSAAKGGCHSCVQLRYALWVRRGHESREPRHDGPLELRYYEQESKTENGPEELELYVVAKTPHAEVKVAFDFVQYSG